MKIRMIIDGLITEKELITMSKAAKQIADELRKDINLEYSMATPYTMIINRAMPSIMDLDDDVDGLLCVITDKKDIEEGCCDEEDPRCTPLGARKAFQK